MVTSMIPSVDNIFVNKSIIDMRFLSAYNPLINYDWSTTTTSGLRYLKDVGSTPTYNASMYFGRGAYLNGVDQTITVPINTTTQTALKRVNRVVTINETSQTLTNYVISGVGAHKDYYLFTRLLTTAEKDSYTNTPEAFYAMAQADNTCVLNMPMCETSSTVRNYKTGIDYPITNYTTSVRDNAKKLQYGLQTCKFVRDSLGVIQSDSDYLECDGVGYADTGYLLASDADWTVNALYKVNQEVTSFELNGTSDNLLYFGKGHNTPNPIVRFNGISSLGSRWDETYHLTTISYSKLTQKADVYFDAIKFGNQIGGATFNGSNKPIILGNVANSFHFTQPIGSFEIEEKYYTQDDMDAKWLEKKTIKYSDLDIDGFDVFLCIGQSNMVGLAGPIDPILDASDPLVYNYGYSGRKLEIASEPLDSWDEPTDSISMGMTFAKEYNKTITPRRATLLVTVAKGGTGFSSGDWIPSGSKYLAAIEVLNEAMAIHQNTSLKGILWHQGESDYALTESEYAAYLDNMILNLRIDLDGATANTPFICGNYIWNGGIGVKTATANTPNRVNNTGFVDLSDLNDKGDELHFDAPSLRIMGERYHSKFIELIS